MDIKLATDAMHAEYGYDLRTPTVLSEALSTILKLNSMLRQGMYIPGLEKNILVMSEGYGDNEYRGILIQNAGNAVLSQTGAIFNLETENSPLAYGFELNQGAFSGLTPYVSTMQGIADLGTRVETIMKSERQHAVMAAPGDDRLYSELDNMYKESMGIVPKTNNAPIIIAALAAGLGAGYLVARKLNGKTEEKKD